MKTVIILLSLFIFSSGVFAQTLEDRVRALEESLKQQQQAIREIQGLKKTVKEQEQTISTQRKLIEELKAEVKQPRASAPPAADQTAATERMRQEVGELKEQVGEVAEAQKKEVPSVFNPSIGFVGETIFSYNSKGSNETDSERPGGFDVNLRSAELDLAASVGPFAKAYAVLNASADPVTGEASVEVEEAAIQTTSLPWNLELKAGRFFAEFGRLSYIHEHELPWVNRPLALEEYIGGESKTDGLQVNYLLPFEHYVSLTVGAGDQFGEIPNGVGDFRNFNELNFWGRASTYFDLTPDVSFETGVSGLWNPRANDRDGEIDQPDGGTLTERERRLLGGDFYFNYRPLRNNEFKTITWGTELLYSDNLYDSTSPDGEVRSGSVGSLGLYSYLAYKFHRQWTAGFAFDWVENAQNNSDQTYAYSPYITWALSHWNFLRLQYTHTDHNDFSGLPSDDAVYLQWAWIIGSHTHGWQQR